MASTGVVRAGMGALALLCVGLGATGCGVAQSTSGADSENKSTTFPATGGAIEPVAGAASGDPFAKAVDWPVVPGERTSLSGTLHSPQQVDILDIGPVYPGDRIHVEVQASSELDAAVAVLDADQNVLIVNDDRSFYSGLTDPLANVLVLHDSPGCYIAVTASPAVPSSGSYTLDVLLTEESPPDPPAAQRVYLNFDGAWDVVIGTRPAVDVPVFDAALIDPSLSGTTEAVIDRLIAMVREDYTGLNVDFYSSREAPPPEEPYTTIHFGAYDSALLGVAENVDEYNERPSQQAIVFVDTFAAFAVLEPSVEEISQALANVTSHECGHLLGLYHTEDFRGVMDISATLRQMLGNQSLALSPLHAEVFSVAQQDAVRTLLENVGGDAELLKRASLAQRAARPSWYDVTDGPPARSERIFGACRACLNSKSKRQAAIRAAALYGASG
jgi:hypothetical protein